MQDPQCGGRRVWFVMSLHVVLGLRSPASTAAKKGIGAIHVVFFSMQGPDTLPFLVLCYGVQQSRPTIIIQECTPRLTIFHGVLGGLYEVRSRQVYPTSLGAKCLRLRQVVGVVLSHGCKGEARIRWVRV